MSFPCHIAALSTDISGQVLIELAAIFLTMEDAIEEVHETEEEAVIRKEKEHEFMRVRHEEMLGGRSNLITTNRDKYLGSLLCRVMFSKHHHYRPEQESSWWRQSYAEVAERCRRTR